MLHQIALNATSFNTICALFHYTQYYVLKEGKKKRQVKVI